MPHITLEYSNNVNINDTDEFFQIIHSILVKTLPTQLENCKTRIIKYSEYYMGDGDQNNAFVHLQIKIIPGRSKETLNEASTYILKELEKFFSKDKLDLKISLEIIELSEFYYKL